MSQIKNVHGLRRLRVRGFAKAKCRIVFAVIALNIKRLSNWFRKQGRIASKLRGLPLLLSILYFLWIKISPFEPSNPAKVVYPLAIHWQNHIISNTFCEA